LCLFRRITVPGSGISRGEPDTQVHVAHGSTVLSTRHFRWAEARLPLSAAGASSRAFVPALCCMIIQVSRCLGAWRSCGRPLVAVTGRVWRDMPGASEEERAVGDGVFLEFLRRPASHSDSGCASRSRPPAPPLAGARGGATRTIHTACEHPVMPHTSAAAGSNADACNPWIPGACPQIEKHKQPA